MSFCHWNNDIEDIFVRFIKKCKINDNIKSYHDIKNNVECKENNNNAKISCLLLLVLKNENRSIYDFNSSRGYKPKTSCFNSRRQTTVGSYFDF